MQHFCQISKKALLMYLEETIYKLCASSGCSVYLHTSTDCGPQKRPVSKHISVYQRLVHYLLLPHARIQNY